MDARTLGQRIVNAARLAAAMHLSAELNEGTARQQEAAGGAGNRFSTDGELPLVDDARRSSAGRSRS